jgi:two-component system, cell cycle sensor histidine kinase and response regulator CckA
MQCGDRKGRSNCLRALKRQKYKVLTATTGDKAITCAEKRTAPIDLLLTDVVLPGLNGRELAERIHQLHPEITVLFTSGYAEDTIVRHGVMSEQFHFISKPYSFQSITRRVRQVLDARLHPPQE